MAVSVGSEEIFLGSQIDKACVLCVVGSLAAGHDTAFGMLTLSEDMETGGHGFVVFSGQECGDISYKRYAQTGGGV